MMHESDEKDKSPALSLRHSENDGGRLASNETKHLEDVEGRETSEYYESHEFKARERRVVRKLDFYIAPLMGSFNFIVSNVAIV